MFSIMAPAPVSRVPEAGGRDRETGTRVEESAARRKRAGGGARKTGEETNGMGGS